MTNIGKTYGRFTLTRKVYSIKIFFASVAFTSMLLTGCGKPQGEQKQQNADLNATTPVEMAIARREILSAAKQFSGTLEGEEQANIVAKISERITTINVHVGDAVNAGQVLVELDKSGATSQFYQAQAGFNNAKKTYDRMKALYQEGAISQQSLDGAQTAYDVAKANFDAAKSSVELTTPIPGVITAVNINVGDLTTPRRGTHYGREDRPYEGRLRRKRDRPRKSFRWSQRSSLLRSTPRCKDDRANCTGVEIR